MKRKQLKQLTKRAGCTLVTLAGLMRYAYNNYRNVVYIIHIQREIFGVMIAQ